MRDSATHIGNKLMDYTKSIITLTLTYTHLHSHVQRGWLSPNSKSNRASLGGHCIPCHWKGVGREGKHLLQMLERGFKGLMGGLPLGFPQAPRISASGTCSSSAIDCILHRCALHCVVIREPSNIVSLSL